MKRLGLVDTKKNKGTFVMSDTVNPPTLWELYQRLVLLFLTMRAPRPLKRRGNFTHSGERSPFVPWAKQ